MNNLKIDAPFLDKFNRSSVYISSYEELYDSIIEEISKILSSKLRTPGSYQNIQIIDSPFSYGVRDLQSVGTSTEDLADFKEHCRAMILRFENRISDLEIDDISFDKEKQNLKMNITCVLKHFDKKFTAEIKIS
jgi:predicted component of type VI protein secretion system